MKSEIEAACEWWTQQVQNHLSKQQKENFKQSLQEELCNKVKNHWYEQEPLRGSGYRSILVDDIQTDTVLTKACISALGQVKAKNLLLVLPRNVVMFVNPGRVSLKQCQTQVVHSVYTQTTTSTQQQATTVAM